MQNTSRLGLIGPKKNWPSLNFPAKCLKALKSAWMMYQIARDRINAPGWPLVLEGEEIDDQGYNAGFEFDGVTFNSVNAAIQYYSTQFTLDPQFLPNWCASSAEQDSTTPYDSPASILPPPKK